MKRILALITAVLISASCQTGTQIVTYPAPPNLKTSVHYQVKVDTSQVWVEDLSSTFDINRLPDWFTNTPPMDQQQHVSLANFSCSGPIGVHIKISEPVNSVTVSPASRGIHPEISDSTLFFYMQGPDKLYIEVNDLPPLLLFANPLETDIPNINDDNVKYFGPGEHHPGIIDLQDDQTIYIAGGAIVYGALRGGPKNVTIRGRGILDAGYGSRLALLENANNLTVDGVILRNSRSWTNTLINCRNVTYHNVKVISFGPGGDGINPLGSRNVTIDNCFLRCTDDCIAIKAPDSAHIVDSIRVTNNTMVGYMYSDGVTIGYETNGPEVKNVHVDNCDIIIARGGSRVDGHSAFSIICDGPARIHDILYENIRAEARVYRLFEAHITDGTLYGVNPPGTIEGVTLRNITWSAKQPIILKGYDAQHRVRNITFDNCSIAGVPLTGTDYDLFEINEYVERVNFE